MRDLKFRMVTQTTGKFLGYVGIYDLLRDGSDVLPSLVEAALEGVKFEQFTGLKDKNGKEIYEGDIVKFDCGDQTPAEVVYEAGSYFLKATDDGSLFYDPETDKPCPLGWIETWGLEVIGNIHENPELLKGEE